MDTRVNINNKILELQKIYLEKKTAIDNKSTDTKKYKIIKLQSDKSDTVNDDIIANSNNKRSYTQLELDRKESKPNKLRVLKYVRIGHTSCKLCKHNVCLNKFCRYTHHPLTPDEQLNCNNRTADSLCLCSEIPGTCRKSCNYIDLDEEILLDKFESLKMLDRTKSEFCTPCKYNKKCILIKENKCAFHHSGQLCSCYEASTKLNNCVKAKIKTLRNKLVNQID